LSGRLDCAGQPQGGVSGPHFHIVAPDFQALVRISDLAVIAGEARARDLAEALAWARTHREFLALKWAELSERG
jgi:hypothetical protein